MCVSREYALCVYMYVYICFLYVYICVNSEYLKRRKSVRYSYNCVFRCGTKMYDVIAGHIKVSEWVASQAYSGKGNLIS